MLQMHVPVPMMVPSEWGGGGEIHLLSWVTRSFKSRGGT